jgi:hypothetical protein
MRIYFNLVDGSNSILDPTGVEVESIEEAHREAEKAVKDLFNEDPSSVSEARRWRLNAVDDAGTLLFSLDLDSVVR